MDFSTAINIIVVTHWHDDHIRGISQVLNAATKAKFVCSSKDNDLAFFKAIATARHTDLPESGADEFSDVLRILRERRLQGQRIESVGPVWASEGMILHRSDSQASGAIQIMALSPSHATQALGLHELATFIASRAQPQRRAVALSANQRSIAIWISTGGGSVLLGGDLEQSANPAVGWEAVVDSSVRPPGLACVFKVPHHGSEGADNPRVWAEMLEEAPIALVAPYSSAAKPLPSASDIKRLCGRTGRAYCTAPPEGWKPPRRESAVEKKIREVARAFRIVSRETGHIRVRFSPAAPQVPPSVQLGSPAHPLCERI